MIESPTLSGGQSVADGRPLYRGVPEELEKEFVVCLQLLEQRGASVLCTGQVDRPAVASCLRYLNGDADNESKRVVTVTDGGPFEPYLPADLDRDHDDVRVLEYALDRSASADGRDGSDRRLLDTIDEDLAEVVWDLRPSSEQPSAVGSLPEPTEIRWSLTDLEPLLERSNLQEIASWLKVGPLATIRNADVRGRAHVALPRPADDDVVRELMSIPDLIDLEIRLRREGDAVQQKWILPVDRFPNLDPGHPGLQDGALETAWINR